MHSDVEWDYIDSWRISKRNWVWSEIVCRD